MNEIFDIVDENNRVVGAASRKECHGNPSLCHCTSHVVIFDRNGRVLLQKRSNNKDIQPGKWDTAVGGHLNQGESFKNCALRELNEELGVWPDSVELRFAFDMKIRNKIESENVRVYSCIYEGPFQIQNKEISKLKFWKKNEIYENLQYDIFTPNCIKELKNFLFI